MLKERKNGMFWKSLLLVSVLFISGCGTSEITPYASKTTDEKVVTDCSSLEPENPYDDGTGHYAGFEWAERVEPSTCSGNSQSFIEGCEDYMSQLEDYDSCISK